MQVFAMMIVRLKNFYRSKKQVFYFCGQAIGQLSVLGHKGNPKIKGTVKWKQVRMS